MAVVDSGTRETLAEALGSGTSIALCNNEDEELGSQKARRWRETCFLLETFLAGGSSTASDRDLAGSILPNWLEANNLKPVWL